MLYRTKDEDYEKTCACFYVFMNDISEANGQLKASDISFLVLKIQRTAVYLDSSFKIDVRFTVNTN